jgi:Na+-translocating ferredoxin:NAD+ oxidoreductase RnfD subunit
MLLYAAEQLWVVAFAASVAIASKYILRLPVGDDGGTRHFYNPSNFGIALTLALFPMVGIAPPYQFAENISGALDWLLPLIVITTGTLINRKFTQRLPLICAWLAAFALQALIRALIHGGPILAGLAPMTGFAFILFTFYMVTDPATTPEGRWQQCCFGAFVGAAYGLLMELHIVFGLFFALVLASTARGAILLLAARRPQRAARLREPSHVG